jgi:ABC-type branched-subunit amino acid transport system permease subunit/ABC-type branched-subunit amino acid transport system ATPase component
VTVLALAFPAQVVFAGILTGLTYGLLAVAVILVYRSSRVINLATAELGGLSAAVLAFLVVNHHVSYWVALPACVLLGGLVGVLIEVVVVRRLADAPRVMLLVATIGVAQLLLFCQAILPRPTSVRPYPTPFAHTWKLGGLFVRGEHVVILVVMPPLCLALAWFLARTRSGLAIRAAAANPSAARLAGISLRRTSTLTWGIAGAFSALAIILAAPFTTTVSSDVFTLGPGLLVRVLAAALIGRMSSLPRALVGGVAIGVVESVVFYNNPSNRGLTDLLVFGIVLVVLLVLGRGARQDSAHDWSFAPRSRSTGAQPGHHWIVRWAPYLVGTVAVLAGLVPLVAANTASQQYAWSTVLIYAMAALSLTVLTGWSGHLSIGQFAFVGLGAMTAATLIRSDIGPGPALLAAAVVGALAAVLVGTPGIRLPGLFLAVSTLALGVASSSWLLAQPIFLHGESAATLPRLIIGSVSLTSQRTYYVVCLVFLVVTVWCTSRLRRSAVGRALVAVRCNEPAASSLGLSATTVKLAAFAISGGLAGLSGALLAGLLVTIPPDRFSGSASLSLVAIAVIGGMASVAGTILGALWVVGIPALFPNSASVPLLTSGAGLLALVLLLPGGLAEFFAGLRDRLVRALDRGPASAHGEVVPAAPPRALATIDLAPFGAATGRATGPALDIRGLRVARGERLVVRDVDLQVGGGEIIGLIGANGAGKSTMMDAVGGFVPCTGGVDLLGQDITGLSPARRARLGLGRTYQGAELFADLTVRETVQVALDRPGTATAGLDQGHAFRRGRARRAECDALLDGFGLGPSAERFVDELSTGTRRILELACLVATGSRVLCLDEPTAGIAQYETESLAPFLLRMRDELEVSLLVIEHDVPFIMGISDRLYCLDDGRIIAEGRPDEIREHPEVVAAYLGTGS